jgi:Tol biopolymer transport system component
MFVTDRATGKAVRLAEHDNTLEAQGHWSPDGERIVYAWYEEGQQAQLLIIIGRLVPIPISRGEVVVCDEQGKNERVLLKLEGCGDDDFSRFQQWSQNRDKLIGWFPTRAQVKSSIPK